MPASISEETRYKIVFEYARCKNFSQVARRLHLDYKTVRKWALRHKQSAGVRPVRSGGRKSVLSEVVAQQAMHMLLSGKYSGSQEVAVELHKKGLTSTPTPVHRTTVARHAKAVGRAAGAPIRAVQSPPQKQLTAANMTKRLEFCKTNLRRHWGNVMFTDRKKFHFYYPGVRIHKVSWVRVGERRTAPKVNHAMCVNMYAGITIYGATKPHLVVGTSKMPVGFKNLKGAQARNITSQEYEKVMANLLEDGSKLFKAYGVTSWVFQQDNDPTHGKPSATAVKTWNGSCKGSAVNILPNWPPNSPDLNLIENVWAYVQNKVDKAGCKTFEDFKVEVIHLMKTLPEGMLKSMYGGMRGRLMECMSKNGGKIRH